MYEIWLNLEFTLQLRTKTLIVILHKIIIENFYVRSVSSTGLSFIDSLCTHLWLILYTIGTFESVRTRLSLLFNELTLLILFFTITVS